MTKHQVKSSLSRVNHRIYNLEVPVDGFELKVNVRLLYQTLSQTGIVNNMCGVHNKSERGSW